MNKEKLKRLREEIDQIDTQILEFISKRAQIALKIGKIKGQNKLSYWDPRREKEIFSRLKALNSGPLPNKAILNIFHEIITATREIQHPTKVGFLGPEATFSHMAALKHFGSTVQFYPLPSIKEVFWEVEKGSFDYGVVPVENSTEGIVTYTLDMFMQSELKVVGEIFLRISHYLAAPFTEREKIKKIYAHPQAVAQCRNWLSYHFPAIPVYETQSTSMAALKAKEDTGAAAITTKLAAEKAQLFILEKHIEDFAHNTTRFWIIGQSIPQATGSDRTSLLFATPHRPGALYRCLKPFADRNINLSKLESRPMKNLPWHYLFFVDLEGHFTDDKVKDALKELKEVSAYLKLLGSYPKAIEESEQEK